MTIAAADVEIQETELTGEHRSWLLERGVAAEHVDRPFPLRSLGDAIAVDIVAADGTVSDVGLWSFRTRHLSTLYGVACALGEGLFDVAGDFPLSVWRSPGQWLRSGRDGIVPIDWKGVAARTVGRRLVASDQKERDEIAWRLGVATTPIVIRADGVVRDPRRRMPSAEELQWLADQPGTKWVGPR